MGLVFVNITKGNLSVENAGALRYVNTGGEKISVENVVVHRYVSIREHRKRTKKENRVLKRTPSNS